MRLLGVGLAEACLFFIHAAGNPLFNHVVEDIQPNGAVTARPVPPSHVRHEWHEPHHVEGWAKTEKARTDASLPMRIGLKQSNIQRGHDMLMERSSPGSPKYGKHLTSQEVTDLFAPSNKSADAVRDWLVASGIGSHRISQSTNKQWIQFDAQVREVEKLLFTSYHTFEHAETGLRSIACSEYHVPLDVKEHVDYITPGIKLASFGVGEVIARREKRKLRQKRRQFQADLAYNQPTLKIVGGCEKSVTPDCIKKQYQIPSLTTATPGNELGIFQSLGQHYLQEDLDAYFAGLAPYVPNGTFPELRAINGAFGPVLDKSDLGLIGQEADLDFQMAIPLIYPQKTVLFQADDEWYEKDMMKSGTAYTGFFNTLFDAIDGSYCNFTAYDVDGNCEDPQCKDPVYPNPNPGGYQGELMCGVFKPTNVISISYSGVERLLPYSYMQRQCLEVLKLGLLGVTVVESSGDNGVGGTRYDRRAGCLGADRSVFSPRTMSNCPYILSVGATVLVNDTARNGTTNPGKYREVATTIFPSGGGFSNVFETPVWQETHVANYLKRANLPFEGYDGGGINYSQVGAENGRLFNKAGRGYPDVAAAGDNIVMIYRGFSERVGGTSVAVPIWAAILTIINEERLAANKSTLGFVSPVLYENPQAFNDITTGKNPGCGTEGFVAKQGWDPVTGLGTPIYPKLLEAFMGLP